MQEAIKGKGGTSLMALPWVITAVPGARGGNENDGGAEARELVSREAG